MFKAIIISILKGVCFCYDVLRQERFSIFSKQIEILKVHTTNNILNLQLQKIISLYVQVYMHMQICKHVSVIQISLCIIYISIKNI